MQDLYDKVHPLVKKVARSTENRWNKMLDADDIEQELWLFIMESPSVQEYLRTRSDGEIVNALNIQADNICSKERLDYEHFTGNFLYNPADVRDLLGRMTQEERVLDDERIDFEIALEDLRTEYEHYYDSIYSHYYMGYEFEDNPARVRCQRAVDKLADLMNRKRSQRSAERTEGPGTRPKITTTDY